jgi:hypothetical protein
MRYVLNFSFMSFPRAKKSYFKLRIELVLNMFTRLSKLSGENIYSKHFYFCNANEAGIMKVYNLVFNKID